MNTTSTAAAKTLSGVARKRQFSLTLPSFLFFGWGLT